MERMRNRERERERERELGSGKVDVGASRTEYGFYGNKTNGAECTSIGLGSIPDYSGLQNFKVNFPKK